MATLECAAQVRAAASTMHSTGSPVMALSRRRTSGAFSAGASVSSRMCSASSIRPSPIDTRPRSLIQLRAPMRNPTSPMMKSTGATAATLNDSTWTIRVVPTFAPSMIASAGTRATRPSPANEAVISPVAVLLCSTAVSPSPAAKAVKRLPSAVDSRCRSSEPNARRMPLWTMCRPHSSNATPPIKSRTTIVPIVTHSRPRHRRATLQVDMVPRKRNLRRSCPCHA